MEDDTQGLEPQHWNVQFTRDVPGPGTDIEDRFGLPLTWEDAAVEVFEYHRAVRHAQKVFAYEPGAQAVRIVAVYVRTWTQAEPSMRRPGAA